MDRGANLRMARQVPAARQGSGNFHRQFNSLGRYRQHPYPHAQNRKVLLSRMNFRVRHLVLFAHPKATKVREAQELENTQVLAKPFSPNQLKQWIKKALSPPEDSFSLEDF